MCSLNQLSLVLVIGCWLSQGLAQAWTVQLATYRDYREAQQSLKHLANLHLNAYTEFYMDAGLQYARVRVGCFLDKEAADQLAGRLQAAGYPEALSLPFTAGTAISFCVQRDVGFVLPERWSTYHSSAEQIVFWVSLANYTGFIAHNGHAWRISQTGSDFNLSTAPAEAASPLFYEDPARGTIMIHGFQNPIALASGQLLWQKGWVAVILESDMLVAYTLKQVP